MKSKQNSLKLLRVLPLILLLSLAACATADYNACPPWPVGGAKVADEIQRVCYHENINKCPAVFEWLDRLDKLREQLKACEA